MRRGKGVLGNVLGVDIGEDEVGWGKLVFGRLDLGHVHESS